jgi:hypothetical protein
MQIKYTACSVNTAYSPRLTVPALNLEFRNTEMLSDVKWRLHNIKMNHA